MQHPIAKREEFPLILDDMGLKGFGIEIGVSRGEFSEVLLTNKSLKKIYFVDPWKLYEQDPGCSQKQQDEIYEGTVKLLKKYGDRAAVVRKSSMEAVSDFANEYFDFIYIDANHDYKHVAEDIANWYPKLKKGGIFAGHDYRNDPPEIYGVKPAVDEFCKRLGIEPYITTLQGVDAKSGWKSSLSWYWIKP